MSYAVVNGRASQRSGKVYGGGTIKFSGVENQPFARLRVANGGVEGVVQPLQVTAPKPKPLLELMQTAMGIDFKMELQHSVDSLPEVLWLYEKLNGAHRPLVRSCRVIDNFIRSLQPLDRVQVGLLFSSTVEIRPEREVLENGENLFPTVVRETVIFLALYMVDLRPCVQSALMLEAVPVPPDMMQKARQSGGKLRIENFFEDQPTRMRMNLYLIPVMNLHDYQTETSRILSQYYPEMLTERIPMDGIELANRMGLHVIMGRLHPDEDSLGLMFFSPGSIEVWDEKKRGYVTMRVLPGTMVVNTARCRNTEDANATAVHECCHFSLHRIFYMLQLVANPSWSFHAHRRRKMYRNGALTPVDWTELQAQKMTACLMMPEETAKPAAADFFIEHAARHDVEMTRRAISYLSALYKVSFSTAKYRMIEFGYAEAEGIQEYISDERIPDHGCVGVWPEGCTYTISLKDAASLAAQDAEFAGRIYGGRYLYVEGHFCVRSGKYILRSWKGEAHLTQYARTHIDECCIAFHVRGRTGGAEFHPEMAARNKKEPVTDRYFSRYKFVAEPDTKEELTEIKGCVNDTIRWSDVIEALPDGFYEAVKALLDVKGLSQEELAFRLSVDRKTLYRYISKDRPEPKHIIAISVALNLPDYVGMRLLELCQIRIGYSRRDCMLRTFLGNSDSMDVEKCNKAFEEAGYGRLI